MATNKYVGSRYVPKYFGTWNAATPYEALSIVSDAEGVYTYTSKRPVPAGTPVSNTAYWAQSGTLSESMQMGTISHVDSTKADDANIAANKLNLTFASDYTMNDSTAKALDLNTTVQSGTYGINPSLCQNAPSELSTSADTCQLYVYVLNVNKYTQTLVCPKKGTQYVRINDGTGWSEWLMTGFTPAYATKQGAGLVQLGDGLKAENATGLTTIDHDASLAIDEQNKVGVVAATAEQLGGVKIGSGLTVTPDGQLNVTGEEVNDWVQIPNDKLQFPSGSSYIDVENRKQFCSFYYNKKLKICRAHLNMTIATSGSGNFDENHNLVNGLPEPMTVIKDETVINMALHGLGATNVNYIVPFSITKNSNGGSIYVSSIYHIDGQTTSGLFKLDLYYPYSVLPEY